MLAILAPSGVALAAAVLAFLGVARTVRQKERADRRDHWWKRVEWAAALVRSAEDIDQQIGLGAVTALIVEADTLEPVEILLLQAIIDVVLKPEEDVPEVAHPALEGSLGEGDGDA